MDHSINNTSEALYPPLSDNASSIEQPSSTNTGNLGSGASVTSLERPVPAQISSKSDNLPCDVNTALQARKTEVTDLQEASLQQDSNDDNGFLALILIIVAAGVLIPLSILISSWFAVAIAPVLILAIMLLVKQFKHSANAENYGIEKFCIAMLLEGLKDKTPTANTSADNTELLNVLEKVATSANKQGVKLINYVFLRRFNSKCQDEKSQQELRKQVDEFFDLIFKNAELTACLEKLGFEAKAVQESIHTYVENSPLNQLYKIILE